MPYKKQKAIRRVRENKKKEPLEVPKLWGFSGFLCTRSGKTTPEKAPCKLLKSRQLDNNLPFAGCKFSVKKLTQRKKTRPEYVIVMYTSQNQRKNRTRNLYTFFT